MAGVSQDRAIWLCRNILPHEPALRAWLRRKWVADLDIDDIVQETYARLAATESVDSIRQPRNYAFQTARSIIVSHLRRSRIVSINAVSDIEALNAMAAEPSPEQQLESRDELHLIANALTALPDACRKVLILRRVEGLSQRETAERLNLTENVVEHHMAASIRLLMDIFGRGGKQPSHSSRLPTAALAQNE